MHLVLGTLSFLLGLFLLLLALTDLLWTTFLEGGPPISRHVCHFTFHQTIRFCRGKDRKAIGLAGLVAIISTLVTWTVLIWIGWALIFSSSTSALVDTDTKQPADEVARFYFAGSTIFTLGMGDYKPQGHAWQILAAIAAGSGFLMFGTGLAYLMAVVPAATQKRQLAVVIWALGKSPDDIILRAWNGVDSTALSPHLISLIPMLALMGESHLSFPILHYIHSTKRSASLAVCVASLDEALTILECGLQRGCSLDLPSLGAARQAITEFLQTVEPALIAPSNDDPPPPSLKMLKDMGVPVVDDDLFQQSLAVMTDRRRMLHALVRNEGWTWDAVWPAVSSI
jgi:Ion channel